MDTQLIDEEKCKGDTENVDIDYMRSLVAQFSQLGEWRSAQFWADKVVCAREWQAAAARGAPEHADTDSDADGESEAQLALALGDDVWALAQTLIAQGDHHRALHAIASRDLHTRHVLCLGAWARAAAAAGEAARALQLLHDLDPAHLHHSHPHIPKHRAVAVVLSLKGQALGALERRGGAAGALSEALRADVAHYGALHALRHQHAAPPPARRLLSDAPPHALALRLYAAAEAEGAAPTADAGAGDAYPPWARRSEEALAGRARALIAACRWREALAALARLDEWACGAERGACYAELRRAPELFALAHRLVAAYPARWPSWYCVALYYHLVGKSEVARRYLGKARALGGGGLVWLAHGHSLAADKEHDQAMAAYFKAAQLLPDAHLPKLYIGVECALLNNHAMAERFLRDAEAAGAGGGAGAGAADPHLLHELGVAHYRRHDYRAALHALQRAHALLEAGGRGGRGGRGAAGEATVCDGVGHALRRLGRAAEACAWHERALALRPGHAGSLAALALARGLAGRLGAALDAVHAALAARPDHALALQLLNLLVDKLAALPFRLPPANPDLEEEEDEEVPALPFPVASAPAPAVLPAAAPAPGTVPAAPASLDRTVHTDMSMSFD